MLLLLCPVSLSEQYSLDFVAYKGSPLVSFMTKWVFCSDGKAHPITYIHHTSTYQASMCKLMEYWLV